VISGLLGDVIDSVEGTGAAGVGAGLPAIMFAHRASTSTVALEASTRTVFFSVFLSSLYQYPNAV
jgi:hypothetical protein